MAFESLTERLQQAMGKLRKKGKVSEADVKRNDAGNPPCLIRSRC